MHWAFGYVRHADPAHRYIQTVNFYLDMICVALGAREAEKVFLSDISLGATGDLYSATSIARELVEMHGYGDDLVQYRPIHGDGSRHGDLSPKVLEELDARVRAIVEEQRQRAEKIIAENKAMVATLRDLLLEHKTIDAKVLSELAPEKAAKKAKKKE
jgi:cell division protease FtsH